MRGLADGADEAGRGLADGADEAGRGLADGADGAGRSPRILVVGVGNPLLRDDGLGIHAIHLLMDASEVSPNITLLDGGTQGLRLLGPLGEHDVAIVVDAVRHGAAPGAVCALDARELMGRSPIRLTAHQWDLVDTLAHAQWLGTMPPTRIVGVEPEDAERYDTELSPVVRASLPEVLRRVRLEIERAGGRMAAPVLGRGLQVLWARKHE